MRLERGRAPYRAIAGLPRHKNAAALIKARKAKRFFFDAARGKMRSACPNGFLPRGKISGKTD